MSKQLLFVFRNAARNAAPTSGTASSSGRTTEKTDPRGSRSILATRVHLVFLTMILLLGGMTVSSAAHAQAADTAKDPVEDIENLFSKDEIEPVPATASPPEGEKPAAVVDQKEIKDVSDLGKLQAFKDIAVIQRRYLPKSQRWELYLAPTLNLNDAFFLNFGGTLRFSYYFRERYGIEGIATFLTSSERQVTSDLRDKRGVTTESFVSPKGYYGLDFKWAPIYGKMTWVNRKITPFDLYFSGGLGMTPTNQGETVPTLHIGTGQIFASSKGSAFRWDFSWYSYLASSNVSTTSSGVTTVTKGSASLYHNLMITMGWSLFFPEATYR